MRKHFCIVLISLVTFASCKKNNSGGTDNVTYQPLTAGSEWNYTVTGTSTASFRLTALSRDTLVGGRNYRVFSNSAGPNEYYFKSGNDYYRFANLAELNNQAFEVLYLRDNLAVGQTWTDIKSVNIPVTGFGTVPVTAQFTFTVVARGFDTTINGTLHRDVIRLSTIPVFNATIGGIPANIPATSDIRYYYAKNVGLIYTKNQLSVPLAGISFNTETKLERFTIR